MTSTEDVRHLQMNVAAVFALINVVFVVLLIYAYVQSWRRVRSGLTVSLIVFASSSSSRTL